LQRLRDLSCFSQDATSRETKKAHTAILKDVRHFNINPLEKSKRRFTIVVSVVISLEAPNAPDLAEELAQRLLVKHLVEENFPITSFEHHAILDVSVGTSEGVDAVDADVNDWITYKHSTLKKRRLSGKRQRQPPINGGKSTEEIVCIEIKR
jgi:hypothetical protein